MTRPTVTTTVVLHCRDQGRRILGLVEEILGYDQPVELVVVDDWCRDVPTMEALAALESGGQRVVRAEQSGRPAAWNAGLASEISTDLVALLDADDGPCSSFVPMAARHLDAHPDISFVLEVDAATASKRHAPHREMSVANLLTFILPHRPTALRRSLWNGIGRFDTSLGELSEIDLWLTALERGHRGIAIPVSRSAHRYERSRSMLETWRRNRRQLYAKHLDAVRRAGESLFVAQESVILDLRKRQEDLVGRAHHLDGQLAGLESAIAHILTETECPPR